MAEDDEGDLIDLKEGMRVSNEENEELGTLAALLVPEDEEEAEFFIVKSSGGDRLLPFEAVLGVGDGALIVDATSEVLAQYPAVQPDTDPSDEQCEKAYEVYDETAQYESDE